MIAPVGLVDEEIDAGEVDEEEEEEGVFVAMVTVGMDIIIPGYAACNAVVSWFTVLALRRNATKASAVMPVVVTV